MTENTQRLPLFPPMVPPSEEDCVIIDKNKGQRNADGLTMKTIQQRRGVFNAFKVIINIKY